MNFGQAINAGFRNYVNFQGRASRSEYWYWILFTTIVRTVLSSLGGNMSPRNTNLDLTGGLALTQLAGSALVGLWGLAVLLPTLGVTIRRLRDAGYSPKRLFWGLAPVGLMVITMVTFAFELVSGTGKFFSMPESGQLTSGDFVSALGHFAPALALLAFTGVASLGIGIWFIVMLTKPSIPAEPNPEAQGYESTLY